MKLQTTLALLFAVTLFISLLLSARGLPAAYLPLRFTLQLGVKSFYRASV
jgi:hypothetical protein